MMVHQLGELFAEIMVLKSYTNLLDMCCENLFDFQQPSRSLPRVVTSPGIISDPDWGSSNDGNLVGSTPICNKRKFIVANLLPMICEKNEATREWSFAMDNNQLLVQLKDGFPIDNEVI